MPKKIANLKNVSISITVVFYNNGIDSINKVIDNILGTTIYFKNVCLYLINNSPDNTEINDFLNLKKSQSNRISVLIPSKNKGFGSGNNLVLPVLTSDYHFIINPDVIIPDQNEIIKMINYLEKNPKIGLLSPLIKFPDGNIQHLLKKETTIFDMTLRFIGLPFFKKRQKEFVSLPDGYSNIHRAENVPGSFMIFRTSVFEKINGFDEKFFLYMEDSDITKSVNNVSESIFFPDAFVYHEWQRQNRKSLKGILTMLRSTVIYFNKWGWKFF
ncbi:glycosyltransferase [Oenococcus oeni]